MLTVWGGEKWSLLNNGSCLFARIKIIMFHLTLGNSGNIYIFPDLQRLDSRGFVICPPTPLFLNVSSRIYLWMPLEFLGNRSCTGKFELTQLSWLGCGRGWVELSPSQSMSYSFFFFWARIHFIPQFSVGRSFGRLLRVFCIGFWKFKITFFLEDLSSQRLEVSFVHPSET